MDSMTTCDAGRPSLKGQSHSTMTLKGHTNTSMFRDSNNIRLMREALKEERQQAYSKTSDEMSWKDNLWNAVPPETPWRMTWDCALLLLISYSAIVVPMDLGLPGLTEGPFFDKINLFLIVFFSLDIVLNFKTAYYNHVGELESRYALIAKRYIKSWFFLDLFSTIPFDDIMTSSSSMRGTVLMRLPRIVKMARLARLLRVAKIQQVVRMIFGLQLLTNVYIIFMTRFAYLFSFLLLVTHWLACAFCGISEIPESNPPLYGDVEKVGWTYVGINAKDLTDGERYRASFYFAFCSAVGPKPPEIKFETSHCRYFYMLFGFVRPLVSVSIMGVLTKLIVSQDRNDGNLKQKMQALGIFMQVNQVKSSIQHQVFAYLEHAHAKSTTLQDLEAIKTLSPTLQEEVAYRTLNKNIKSFVLFKKAFGKDFIQKLCQLLRLQHNGPDDIVCKQDHYLTEMFFVDSGILKCFRADQAGIRGAGQIGVGQVFGALALLQEGTFRSSVTVLCFDFCELTALTKKDFMAAVSQNPDWDDALKKLSSALYVSDNKAKLAEDLVNGDDDVLESILSIPKSKSSEDNKWRRAGNKIIAHQKLRQMMKGNATEKREDDATVLEVDHEGHIIEGSHVEEEANVDGDEFASGFRTMQMSPFERHMMEQLSKISSKVDRVNGVDQRVHAIEQHLQHLNQMLAESVSLGKIERRLDRQPSEPSTLEAFEL